MKYSTRLSIALALSLLVHGAPALWWRHEGVTDAALVEPPPLRVRLREERLPFIETNVPAEEPPLEAEYISIQDSKAMDSVVTTDEAERSAPTRDGADVVDVLPSIPPPREEDTESVRKPEETVPVGRTPEYVPVPTDDGDRFQVAQTTPEPPMPPRDIPTGSPEPSPYPETPSDELNRDLRVRERGRTVTHGVTNFEALRHEIAPYLEHIKKRVERHWVEALLMRYSGTNRTRAEVFCAIAPDGSLAELRIIGVPVDPLFAALCRDALDRAAPFDPFPFEVPDIYRNQNLEISWSFNFL